MQTFNLPLVFSPEQEKSLRRELATLSENLEKRGLLPTAQLHQLRAALSNTLAAQPTVAPDFLEKLYADSSDRPQHLHLTANKGSDELLNLPWHLLAEGYPNLLISKGLPQQDSSDLPTLEPNLAFPLKILVMVSAPEDGSTDRLKYEEEEKLILDALTSLVLSGEVELDFTDDGSLESLGRSLAANRYHVLHFSGHGAFSSRNPGETPEATLFLEDEFVMSSVPTSAVAFAELLADSKQAPALVVLSACQSGKGSAREGFQGVAHHLLQKGIPAVVAMGLSVADFWATHFAGAFFKALAERKTLGRAFNLAIEAGRQQFDKNRPAEFFASQSLVPQLFLTKQVSEIVRWQNAPEQKLNHAGQDLLLGSNVLAAKLKKVNTVFGRDDKDLIFIGRRRERKAALANLRNGRSVLLRGQGGVGKTALALNLVLRKLTAEPDTCLPLAFDETNLRLDNICNTLLRYLEIDATQDGIRFKFTVIEKQWEKLLYLLDTIKKQNIQPFFIFDNLESFQESEPGGPLKQDIAELMQYLLPRYPVLCTGRYTLREFSPENLTVIDMNEATVSDFFQKCLKMEGVCSLNVDRHSFDEIAAILRRSLGGNYRALEKFDQLCRKNRQNILKTLDMLEQFINRYQGETLQKMSHNLAFEQLLHLLSPDERRAFLLLAEFRQPVLPFAVEWQDGSLEPVEVLLTRAVDLTLVERRVEEAKGRAYFFVAPLVRELLGRRNEIQRFDDERAGAYFEKVQEQDLQNIADFEEAFFYYERARNVKKVNEIGSIITNYLYNASQFQSAFKIGMRTYSLVGKDTYWRVFNRIAQVFQKQGKHDDAILFFKKAYSAAQQHGEPKDLGTLLNNTAQVYADTSNYKTALSYLKKSLKISQNTNDFKGEGIVLNNIGLLFSKKSDYKTALRYLNNSLNIRQAVGDLEGEGATQNNISDIYQRRGDYDSALQFSNASLKLRKESKDRQGEARTLNRLGVIHKLKGEYDSAVYYYQESLRITQELGDLLNEGSVLNNIATIFLAQGNFDLSILYMHSCLLIRQKVGDRTGEGDSLYNLGLIRKEMGEYDASLSYLEKSLKIRKEIDDFEGVCMALHNMATIYHHRNDYDTFLKLENEAYQIAQKIDNAKCIFEIGRVYGKFKCENGENNSGLQILNYVLKLGQQLGFSGIVQILNDINKYSIHT